MDLDEFCRNLETGFKLALRPVRPLTSRADRYLASRDASPLGQTLLFCAPMLTVFFLTLLAIDLR